MMQEENPFRAPQGEMPSLEAGTSVRCGAASMSRFDRFCAVLAFILGIVLLILGVIGLFTGCCANFTLPPVLGVVPALVGWGILKSVRLAWRVGS